MYCLRSFLLLRQRYLHWYIRHLCGARSADIIISGAVIIDSIGCSARKISPDVIVGYIHGWIFLFEGCGEAPSKITPMQGFPAAECCSSSCCVAIGA